MGTKRTACEAFGDKDENSGGSLSLGCELSTESGVRLWEGQRRRLLGGEGEMVLGESGVSSEDEPGKGLLNSEESLSDFEEEAGICDSSDGSDAEEEGGEFTRNAVRWGVAFRRASELPWTDAQWVAYWRGKGYFLSPGEPFAIPFST